MREIKADKLYPFVANMAARLDGQEVLIFKSYQVSRRLDAEMKRRELFEGASFGTNRHLQSVEARVNLPMLRSPLQKGCHAGASGQSNVPGRGPGRHN